MLTKLLSVFILSVSILAAQTLYVATAGDDLTGDGSPERPYASITAAAAAAPLTGGAIVVQSGVYTGFQRINRKFTGWLTIRAESPYGVQLQSGTQATLQIYDAAYVEITGFDVSRTTAESSNPLAAQIARSQNIILRNNFLHDSRNNDVLKINEASRDILIIGNVFYNAQGPAGQHIDVNGTTNAVIRDNIFFDDFDQNSRGTDGSAYIVVKNSGEVPESRRMEISNNIFLNWQGGAGKNFILLGEDGKPFHETQNVLIENNLLLGNSDIRMRAPLGFKGVKDIVVRNNTFAGDFPGAAFAMRLNREGFNPVNRNIRFLNNIWSSPNGTMKNFSDGLLSESSDLELRSNVYWNGGQPLASGSVLSPSDDPERVDGDPLLGSQQGLTLPRWSNGAFASGSRTIREEFERLVKLYGTPADESRIRARNRASEAPAADILDRLREGSVDPGAVQTGAASASLRLVLVPAQITGGLTSTLNQVILPEPAGPDGVTVNLSSSNPGLARVPEHVVIAPGMQAATFAIGTLPVSSGIAVRITASTADRTRSLDLLITPQGISSLNLSPDTVSAGLSTARNLVLIDGVAPDEGAVVRLFSSQPDVVTIPDSVRILPGRSYSEFFPIQTRFTPQATSATIQAVWEPPTPPATASPELRSSSGAAARTAVKPAGARFNVQPMDFTLALNGASTVSGDAIQGNRIFLPEVAPPGGTVVSLSSSPAGLLIVPDSVVVPEGSNIGEFSVQSASGVRSRTRGTITASWNNRQLQAGCDVAPVVPKSIAGPAIVPAGGNGTFRVFLNGTSDDQGITLHIEVKGATASYPSDVVVSAGQTVVNVVIRPDFVAQITPITVSATWLGVTVSTTASVDIVRPSLLYLPDTARSGSTDVGIVNLNSVAPPGGLLINLTSSDPNLVPVPDTVMAAEGASSARFILKIPINAKGTVVVTASANGVVLSRKMNVGAPTLGTFTLSPATIKGGESISATIGMRGLLPDIAVLEMNSSDPDVIATPQSVSLPANASAVRITLPTNVVAEEKDVTLTVRYAGASAQAKITVQP